jgi:threonine dehydratase
MVTAERIREAHSRISEHISRTPLIYSDSLSRITGARVYLKCENFQKTGSFKIRGAFNKLSRLKGESVIAASMGNHAQGVAAASAALGIKATIVMPEGVSPAKENAVREYGAEVVLRGQTLTEALEYATSQEGYTFIHPFDDEEIIAGQGTIGLEITDDLEGADYVIVPVGGGGLISGVSTYIKSAWPGAKVIGVQAEGATSALESFKAGKVVQREPGPTLADGIAVGRAGEITLKHMQAGVDEVLAVSEAAIARAVLLLMERKKLVVEGAGAAGLALVLEDAVRFSQRSVVIVISGGNIDFTLVDRIIHKGLAESGRTGTIEVVLDDAPGALHRLTGIIAARRGNILNVVHDRLSRGLPVKKTSVSVTLEVRSAGHLGEIVSDIKKEGIQIKEVPQ